MRLRVAFGVICAVALAALPSWAHHSHGNYVDTFTDIEGVVKEFVWRNPHSFVRIEVTTKEGTTELWNLEWGSTTQLQAAKYPITRTTIKPGDKIIAGGEPGRDPAAKRVRIFSIKRPIDGWEWEGTVD